MTMMKTIFALAGVLCFGAFAVEAHDQPLACVVTERTMYTWNN